MRVLLLSHRPVDDTPSGRRLRDGLQRLRTDGFDVRLLAAAAASAPVADEGERFRHVRYAAPPVGHHAWEDPPPEEETPEWIRPFAEWTNRRLSDYRNVLRQALDREIERHDPHVVHALELWLFAHLALEAGVPYVAAVDGGECAAARHDARYRRFVTEAAENACRVLTFSPAVFDDVAALVGRLEGRLRLLAASRPATAEAYFQLAAVPHYHEAFVERFGREPQ